MRKNIVTLFLMLCIATLGYAQIVADLGAGAAGTLNTKVPEADRATLTNLTVKGEMDSRDFMFIKENLPALETLDLQDANIVYFEGEGGTMGSSNYYEANHLPTYAFKDNASITKIVFPKSLVAVDYLCFYNTQLTEMDFSNTKLETIVNSAISANYKLTSVSLPATLKEVGDCGLAYNYYLASVKVAMADPTAVNAEQMFGKSQKWDPEKQEYVKDEQGNPIWVENTPPAGCVLYVPAGKVEAYKALKPWNLFTTIEETAGAPVLPTPELKFEKATVTVKVGDAPFKNMLSNPENVAVTYTSSDEKVATVDAEGLVTILAQGVTTITATSQATADYSEATASFQLTVEGEGTEVVPGNTIDMGTGAAGTLSTKIPEADRATLTNLAIKGEIDVRDFVFIKNSLPALQTLDLLNAKIVYYQGTDGTMNGDNYYSEDELPAYAFQYNTSITKVVFPNSLTGIGYCAINGSQLEEVDLSKTRVATIAGSGLAQNQKLVAVSLPATMKSIENYGLAFNTEMVSLEVAVQDPTQLDAAQMLGVRYKYDYENNQYVTDENGNYVIESEEVPPVGCVLYVPAGKIDAYKALKPWSLFTEIKEIVTGDPSKKNPELSFEKADIVAKMGDAPFKNVLTNPENVAVTYTSSNETVATVDAEGMITVLAPGVTTITATSEATEIYNEATASFQLTVKGNATYKDGVAEMGTDAAGTLATVIPQDVVTTLTELTITGEIDARDFKFLKNLTALKSLNMENAVIVAYTGAEGTYPYGDEATEYEPNHLPSSAFDGNKMLAEIVFPTSLEAVDYLALADTRLETIDLSNTALKVLDSSSIERNPALTTIVFPSTLKFAAERSLANNDALTSFTCHVADPKDITDGIRGMFGINYKRDPVTNEYIEDENGEYIVESIVPAPENCVLYVQEASVELYKADAEWNELFTTIVAIGTTTSIDREEARMPLQVTQGGLCVNADAAMVRVYDVAGNLAYQQKVEGEAQIALRSGLYIIQVGGKAQRIVIP